MLPLHDRLVPRRLPVVNYALIAANVVLFMWERFQLANGVSASALIKAFAFVPAEMSEAPFDHAPRILSSMFLHAPESWFHISGNMLFLWIFGDAVEDALGRARYLALYTACGIAGAMGHFIVNSHSAVPVVGASAAISGILAAYGSLYPRSPVTVLNPLIPLWLVFGVLVKLPAWLVILGYFLFNLYFGLLATRIGVTDIAFFSHLGGFVAGIFLVRLAMVGREPGARPPKDARRFTS